MHESEKWKWSHSVVSDSSQPHGLQPTRLLHPWDFPDKSTGVASSSKSGSCLFGNLQERIPFFFFFWPLPVSGSPGCLVAFGILTAISICIFMWPTSLYISVSLQRCRDGACGAHLLASLLSCEDTSPIGIVTTLEQYNLILITFSNTLFLHKVTSTGSGVGLQHISWCAVIRSITLRSKFKVKIQLQYVRFQLSIHFWCMFSQISSGWFFFASSDFW